MMLSKTVYTLGEVGEVSGIAELMRKDECGWLYFVYKTDVSERPLHIGTFQSLKTESGEVVVIGVASSRELARRLAMHIVLIALSLDNKIINGINKLAYM